MSAARRIDVIVPVCAGGAAVVQCIEQLLATPHGVDADIVVVNDAVADAELVTRLRARAAANELTLLENASPHGFAAAVNHALALHPERDFVVVHADVEVSSGWLARLAMHAASAPHIGAVAAFADHGAIVNYPRSDAPNALPAGCTVEGLDALFQTANPGRHVALPAVGGPCVYFRRECVTAAGVFDGDAFVSPGAVEEDLCLRAAAVGFIHLVAGDVFVGHPAVAEATGANDEQALAQLYPEYPAQARVARRDVQPLARRVDLLRLAASPRTLLVFVAHAWGGGIRRHMTDLAGLVAAECEVLHLEPAGGTRVRLYWPKKGEEFSAWFELPAELPELARTLNALGVARLHFHHVHQHPPAILELPAAAGLPYDCTLHDYYAVCPQYHLVDAEGRYCGEPDAAGCAACLARRPGLWGLDIAEWRQRFGALLAGAERIIAPSTDVAERMRRYQPQLAVEVWSHPEAEITLPVLSTRVVVLGTLSPEKGLRIVAACAADAHARSLPLTFRIIGSTTAPIAQAPAVPLSIHGQYEEADLARLLVDERPDVIWFPAQVPETYSYTLSIALASGLPIVASALGAFPERLAGQPAAVTVSWGATPAEWNAALLAAGAKAKA